MSVLRQNNFLGQQRVDIPHLRSLESAVAGDFDLLAGNIIAGRQPVVVQGFKLITTGISKANALQLKVADGVLIHYYASESGSIFRVAADRSVEILSNTNPRVRGGFTPSQVNFIGIDLLRRADLTTADLTMFLDANTLLEDDRVVPLARTLDYQIVISTVDFASTPGICPVAKVTTNSANTVTDIEDARQLMFRLGQGGSVPRPHRLYSWPQGRSENTDLPDDVFFGGDKAITSMKEWCEAVMSRIWELSGGPYWYSPTADKNIKLIRQNPVFSQNGENLYWDGTNILWKGLQLVFENSFPIHRNIITDQTVANDVTNLADGECIYVDLDRTTAATLVAQKAPMDSLGVAASPGNRVIIIWRVGSAIFSRDNQFPVNQTFKAATVSSLGTVSLSASAAPTLTSPIVAVVQGAGLFQAFCGGITRGDVGSGTVGDFIDGAGDLYVGGGDMDHNVFIATIRTQDGVEVTGRQVYSAGAKAALTVTNDPSTLSAANRILNLRSFNSDLVTYQDAIVAESTGALGFRNVVVAPAAPAITADSPIRSKLFFNTNGLPTPFTRDQFCIQAWDGAITVLWQSHPY